MIKANLQVLILKDFVLLPRCEFRIEIKNSLEKEMVDSALKDDNGYILVINNNLNYIDVKKFPKIGVIAKIKSKIILPNGNIRISLLGKNRVKILKYYKLDNSLYKANIERIEKANIDKDTTIAYKRKIYESFIKLINKTSYIDPSIIKQLDDIDDLEVITDIICQILPLSLDRKEEYILEFNKLLTQYYNTGNKDKTIKFL